MYFRIVKAAGAQGTQHEYVRLVEAYRENGKNKQRVVLNLGRKDLLAEHLDSLIALLRDGAVPVPADPQQVPGVRAVGAWDWGPALVARTLWEQLGLDQILIELGGRSAGDGAALSDRALVLVTNRLCAPASEHGLARWLETDYVCDRQGRRWMPLWRDDAERSTSRLPRVRVQFRQLKQWYRTLDQLQHRKAKIEKELFYRLRSLLCLKADLVFYDLTSTYFEGQGPALAVHGHSRDGKPRNRQVLVGLVLIEGWPIAHHVLRGNMRDAKTVPLVLEDLQKRFGLRRVVFVGDRGMVTADNVNLLRAEKQGYVVGLNRRRREDVFRYIEKATGPWTACPVGIAAREKDKPPLTEVQEVSGDEPGVRIFVVRSQERLSYEQGERFKVMQRVRAHLEKLEKRVQTGKLKAPDKIGAAAARILTRHHGHRYYDWEYKEGQFRFFEHPTHLKREQAYEGKYIIQTEEKDLTAVQAVTLYKELSEVERSFRNLKDVLDLRPIYHQTDKRVEGHIFVAALAFLLHRALEKKLKAAGLDLSSTEALQALRSVRIVDFQVGAQRKRSVTEGSERVSRILAALGITELQPPSLSGQDKMQDENPV